MIPAVARYPTLADLRAVTEPAASGCLLWKRGKDSEGYGSLRSKGRTWRAHELAWHLAGGERPDGYVLHHVCETRLCVNIDHLTLVTRAEHWEITKAGDPYFETKRAAGLRRQLCELGHDNWYVHPRTGKRQCRCCQNEWQRTKRRRKA